MLVKYTVLTMCNTIKYQDLFAITNSLPGPASTKMLFNINIIRGGFFSGALAFLIWRWVPLLLDRSFHTNPTQPSRGHWNVLFFAKGLTHRRRVTKSSVRSYFRFECSNGWHYRACSSTALSESHHGQVNKSIGLARWCRWDAVY